MSDWEDMCDMFGFDPSDPDAFDSWLMNLADDEDIEFKDNS